MNINIDEDFILALQLQEQFVSSVNHQKTNTSENTIGRMNKSSSDVTSVVDPSWEYVDPTPDIHALFIQFDRRFFWGKLKQVEVRWSPRMTSCAGICCYEGQGGLCSVRLSVPLLKLRPRKDLVETLLHEMIHAYLFVTHNNRDRDGHGPEFHKHMNRINKEAGTNITVYHSFHDEVKLYKQHWWRCVGPCQKQPPYFGMVKRSMNRAPGPSDFWWNDHQRNCGGRYIKVKEPTGFSDKKVKKANKNSSQGSSSKMGDISKYFSVNGSKNNDRMKNESVTSSNNIFGMKDLSVTSVNNSKTSDVASSSKSPVFDRTTGKGSLLTNKGSGTLVITAKGNNKEKTFTSKPPGNFVPFSGKGNKLGTSSNESVNGSEMSLKRHSSVTNQNVDIKRSKNNNIIDLTADSRDVECPVCGIKITEAQINTHLDSCVQCTATEEGANNFKSDPETRPDSDVIKCPSCNKNISKCEVSSHLEVCLESIFANETANEVGKSDNDDEYPCPCCAALQKHSVMNSHLDQCLSNIWNDFTSATE